MNSTVYDDIKEMLVKDFEVDETLISPEASMKDLNLDSLSVAELLFEIMDKYDIEIPESKQYFNTLGEAVDIIEQLRS